MREAKEFNLGQPMADAFNALTTLTSALGALEDRPDGPVYDCIQRVIGHLDAAEAWLVDADSVAPPKKERTNGKP